MEYGWGITTPFTWRIRALSPMSGNPLMNILQNMIIHFGKALRMMLMELAMVELIFLLSEPLLNLLKGGSSHPLMCMMLFP